MAPVTPNLWSKSPVIFELCPFKEEAQEGTQGVMELSSTMSLGLT